MTADILSFPLRWSRARFGQIDAPGGYHVTSLSAWEFSAARSDPSGYPRHLGIFATLEAAKKACQEDVFRRNHTGGNR